MRIGELAIPALLGAGLALLGVHRTNKNNAATNAANRVHELEKLDRQFHREFKRDRLIRIAESLTLSLRALEGWYDKSHRLEYLESSNIGTPDELEAVKRDVAKKRVHYELRQTELAQATASAGLAVSDDFWKSVRAVEALVAAAHDRLMAERPSHHDEILREVSAEITKLIQSGRNELGIMLPDVLVHPSSAERLEAKPLNQNGLPDEEICGTLVATTLAPYCQQVRH
jgi:hypothetical protein